MCQRHPNSSDLFFCDNAAFCAEVIVTEEAVETIVAWNLAIWQIGKLASVKSELGREAQHCVNSFTTYHHHWSPPSFVFGQIFTGQESQDQVPSLDNVITIAIAFLFYRSCIVGCYPMTKSSDLLPMKYVVSIYEGHTWQAKAGVSAHSWVLGKRPCRAGAATTSSCSPAQIHSF